MPRTSRALRASVAIAVAALAGAVAPAVSASAEAPIAVVYANTGVVTASEAANLEAWVGQMGFDVHVYTGTETGWANELANAQALVIPAQVNGKFYDAADTAHSQLSATDFSIISIWVADGGRLLVAGDVIGRASEVLSELTGDTAIKSGAGPGAWTAVDGSSAAFDRQAGAPGSLPATLSGGTNTGTTTTSGFWTGTSGTNPVPLTPWYQDGGGNLAAGQWPVGDGEVFFEAWDYHSYPTGDAPASTTDCTGAPIATGPSDADNALGLAWSTVVARMLGGAAPTAAPDEWSDATSAASHTPGTGPTVTVTLDVTDAYGDDTATTTVASGDGPELTLDAFHTPFVRCLTVDVDPDAHTVTLDAYPIPRWGQQRFSSLTLTVTSTDPHFGSARLVSDALAAPASPCPGVLTLWGCSSATLDTSFHGHTLTATYSTPVGAPAWMNADGEAVWSYSAAAPATKPELAATGSSGMLPTAIGASALVLIGGLLAAVPLLRRRVRRS